MQHVQVLREVKKKSKRERRNGVHSSFNFTRKPHLIKLKSESSPESQGENFISARFQGCKAWRDKKNVRHHNLALIFSQEHVMLFFLTCLENPESGAIWKDMLGRRNINFILLNDEEKKIPKPFSFKKVQLNLVMIFLVTEKYVKESGRGGEGGGGKWKRRRRRKFCRKKWKSKRKKLPKGIICKTKKKEKFCWNKLFSEWH